MQLSPISLAITRLGGVRFSPSALFPSGTAGAWYDPSDSTTIFEDTAGTIPSPAPGGGALSVVGLMLDKSVATATTGNYSGFFSGYGANVADNPAFTLGSADFTIEFWVRANSVASRQVVLFQGDNSGTNTTISFAFEVTAAAKASFYLGSSSTLYTATSTASLTTNWTHIAAVRNGNTLTLYVNGTADGTADVTGVTVNDSSQLLKFGDYATTGALPYTGYISNFRIVKGTAVYTGNFTPPTASLTAIAGTSFLTFQNNYFKDNSTSALAVNVTTAAANLLNPFDSTAARTINNAISYNTTTARPELSARVNLLTYSENLNGTGWSTLFGGTGTTPTITSNYATAPDGTVTASRFVGTRGASNTTSDYSLSVSPNGTVSSGASYVGSVYIKSNTGSNQNVTLYVNTGAAVQQIVAVAGSTWTRVAPAALTATTTPCNIIIGTRGGSYGGDQSLDILVWGADLRPANIGTSVPAYQRIADQYTYDSSGFPRYLVFNGTASGMYTPANLNLSGTDKATVFAGVRKQADPTDAMLAEFSSVFTNAGSFAVAAPWTSTTLRSYFVAVNGNAINSRGYTGYAAPISNVLSAAIKTTAADSDAAQDVRINAADVAGSSIQSAASTGNFGTYPLYIGSRNNASLWFNGYLYSLIVVGAASTAAQISSTESWINVKEGGVY